MEKMLIGLVGPAGSGKDTVADYLMKKHRFVKMALADTLKRMAKMAFNFTDEQLWGPSEMRNAPDKRYPREHGKFIAVSDDEGILFKCACCGTENGNDQCYLTPRFALQSLGTEWGRTCFENVWVGQLLGMAQTLLQSKYQMYDRREGLIQLHPESFSEGEVPQRPAGIVITDVRFRNEVDAIKMAGGKVVRITRGFGLTSLIETQDAEGNFTTPLMEHTSISAAAAQHKSETELLGIPKEMFDYLFQNSGDLHLLKLNADRMMDVFNGRIMKFDRGLQDAPPFLREKCKELAQLMLTTWADHGTPQPGDPTRGEWFPNTEVHLWSDLQNLVSRGDAPVTTYEEALLGLKTLSDAVNGWFSWRDKTYDAPYFVKRGAWLEELAERGKS